MSFARELTSLQLYLGLVGGGLAALGFLASVPTLGSAPLITVFFALGAVSLARLVMPWSLWLDGLLAVFGAVALIAALPAEGVLPVHHWLALFAAWAFSWLFVERLTTAIRQGRLPHTGTGQVIPLIFGLSLLVIWEVVTRGANVSPVLLPPPSAIAARFAQSTGILWADFVQTFVKSVIPGYLIGCGAGLLVAIAVDRSPFLKAGVMPIGNFMSALPIIGIAPIMVMWFGFDWQSKAAVVVAMTFFPMLVNTVAGLNAASAIERDLMRTYAASYWQTLMMLRLPAAGPFIFNALKINSTLALIGAIVAEFFGTPVVGMGFRISTGVGRLAIDLVWAEIAVAAIAGSAFYGVIALLERGVTFWHPSVRGGRA
ncbi:NitT/TauT family transport system permease protein [Devosia crocina]|uniref:NitT/TauT family transport system permease protein n=1 Tax=Devosia crocina TaxID=429728 RepID=A0A1I7NW13_9HYPH|nr:NitT/TauT family transport system permease protein [Devosia crocina]